MPPVPDLNSFVRQVKNDISFTLAAHWYIRPMKVWPYLTTWRHAAEDQPEKESLAFLWHFW